VIDEPVVMATDYILSVSLIVMGYRLPPSLWRLLFFMAAFAAAVGGTRHGFHSSLPALPLEVCWRVALAAFAFSGWALVNALEPPVGRWLMHGKLVLAVLAALIWGSFNGGLANYALDVGVATALVLSRPPLSRWFLVGTVITALGASLFVFRIGIGDFPVASLFHLVEISGFYCWYRSIHQGELVP